MQRRLFRKAGYHRNPPCGSRKVAHWQLSQVDRPSEIRTRREVLMERYLLSFRFFVFILIDSFILSPSETYTTVSYMNYFISYVLSTYSMLLSKINNKSKIQMLIPLRYRPPYHALSCCKAGAFVEMLESQRAKKGKQKGEKIEKKCIYPKKIIIHHHFNRQSTSKLLSQINPPRNKIILN